VKKDFCCFFGNTDTPPTKFFFFLNLDDRFPHKNVNRKSLFRKKDNNKKKATNYCCIQASDRNKIRFALKQKSAEQY
jgi:hypothetical protein